MINLIRSFIQVIIGITILVSIQSCEEVPTDIGSGFISPDDTLNVKVLDSETDTIPLLATQYKKAFSNFISPFILIGKTAGVESSGLLRFNNLPSTYQGVTVNSAKLFLKYVNYYYTDSAGTLDFNIYKLTQDFSFATVTRDSINSGSYNPAPVGNYSGTPVDSVTVSINLDNNMVKDWLEFAADPNYHEPNYGMIFIPNSASTTIKGFGSTNANTIETPYVEIALTLNGQNDTITLNTTESNFITDGDISSLPSDRITLQSGVSIQNFFRFNLSKLPSNVIVNEARLEMYLDTTSSYYFSVSEKRIVANLITDSTTLEDTLSIINSEIQGNKYILQFNPFVQFWANGTFENKGIALSTLSKRLNIDKFVFYSPTYSDVSKRPRLRITYTIRN
ncbi:DNRLRE domain-containing protein [Ignavibacteria bacterium CHB1]|nr:MAG: DNRLRE domain-containing protein [Chlorobiota bacterium]MBV6397913.1 hypothetical protein [Ignavibacteria bacterium]MCC6886358.1 DNRLRE domain-containing protein [Ignavibacteriales bacterium]MCE7952567.1 hypothetical protein [Chlorobi bacterium CHB7]MDL1886681.1 DNRLRE domain-containing protein [Ignavibacteria bacterium CHB1]RIK47985.1 MAG: hypothetical protein DCC60_08870 [Ignavibacteriota bacterium]